MNAPSSPVLRPDDPRHPAAARLASYLFYGALLVIVAVLLTLFHGVLTDSVREMKARRLALQNHATALRQCAWRPTAGDREACRTQVAMTEERLAVHHGELPNLSTDVEPIANVAYR